jgi:hypothetical protein
MRASVRKAAENTGRAMALALQSDTIMSTEPESAQPTPAGPVVHQFTVLRGMAVALVIETCDWYSGLLQAALARVRLEGQN